MFSPMNRSKEEGHPELPLGLPRKREQRRDQRRVRIKTGLPKPKRKSPKRWYERLDVMGFVGLALSGISLLVFWPDVNVEFESSLQKNRALPARFIVENDSFFALKRVSVEWDWHSTQVEREGGAATPTFNFVDSEFPPAKPNFFNTIGGKKRANFIIPPTGIEFGTNDVVIGNVAAIEIKAKYLFFSLREVEKFEMIRDGDGQPRWAKQAVN
jgi:hypothetical protein